MDSANSGGSGGVKESKGRSGGGNKKTTSAASRDDNMEEESVRSKMLVEQILRGRADGKTDTLERAEGTLCSGGKQ